MTTYKKTTASNTSRLLSVSTHYDAPSGSGLVEIYHNLGYIPIVKSFIQFDGETKIYPLVDYFSTVPALAFSGILITPLAVGDAVFVISTYSYEVSTVGFKVIALFTAERAQ